MSDRHDRLVLLAALLGLLAPLSSCTCPSDRPSGAPARTSSERRPVPGVDEEVESEPELRRIWTTYGPIQGHLVATRDHVFATLDRRTTRGTRFVPHGDAEKYGIGAYDRDTGTTLWEKWHEPGLAAADDDAAYGYARTGEVVSFDTSGQLRWRTRVDDDRSEPARKRDDATSPFAADLVLLPSGVYLPAGNTVYHLSADSGAVQARLSICRGGPKAVVARLALVASAQILIATCTERTAYDDEREVPKGPWVHGPRPTLSELRHGPEELVGLDLDLRELWREPIGFSDNGRPADARDGTAVHSLRIRQQRTGQPPLEGAWLRIDARTGKILVQHTTGSGTPLVVGDRLLLDDYLHSLDTGEVLSHLAQDWKSPLAPAVVDGTLYSASRGYLAVLRPGDTRPTSVGAYVRRILFDGGSRPVSHDITSNLAVRDTTAYLAVDLISGPSAGRVLLSFDIAPAR